MPKAKQDHASRRRSMSDPLSAALRPPPNETPEQRTARQTAEAEAKKRSDSIDEMIRQERIDRKKNKADVHVLLLGQSESGKSTTLKQFQLLHSPAAFQAERIAWRAVVYLNLVRSIRRILDAVSPDTDFDEHEEIDSAEAASLIISSNGRPPSALSGTRVPNYERYRTRLEPLIDLEGRLSHLLSTPDEDEAVRLPSVSAPSSNGHSAVNDNGTANGNGHSAGSTHVNGVNSIPDTTGTGRNTREITVHTSTNWKKAFALGRSKGTKSAHSGEIEGWWEDPADPVHTLHACAPTMLELWRDPAVQARLRENRIRLEESSGFYLDEIPRITAKKYIPTDDDVLKARLKTMGVVEHTFSISSGTNRGVQWKIYDVGGARNQRQAWAPYFSEVNAIIFLAPISAFDQVLSEDQRVNRLEDSLLLWKAVVSNKLLANVNLVLFLNKCDLLKSKLEAGVRLNQHMISYGDRPNDHDSVSKYFRNKFGALHQSYTPNKDRELYIHLTAVTDTRRTATIIADVRDIIIKGNLRDMRLV
ncbi:G-alpha-domain-containing protein [Fistulina hepatica ATCC 64428]|uniref:G-alpha-domain-containing protein n=1 Tax=Fistulina hepatica ATCC 64428 TaxID=1128425 RepID=A0A0D7API6_9AGAR|nr:G-alpha-domain-containing protein [Fistulina hepatica ATCC 64428]